MMYFKKAAVAVIAALAASISCASVVYDYSYQFTSGESILGTFTGDAAGNLISNIGNVTGHIDSVGPHAGYVFHDLLPGSYTDTSGLLETGAVVSFNGLASNFFFFTNITQADWFYVIPYHTTSPNGNATQARLDGSNYIDFNNGFYDPAKFHVAAQSLTDPAAVPEPATLLLLGFGLLGLVSSRRKSA